jgi:hypothetical protein
LTDTSFVVETMAYNYHNSERPAIYEVDNDEDQNEWLCCLRSNR